MFQIIFPGIRALMKLGNVTYLSLQELCNGLFLLSASNDDCFFPKNLHEELTVLRGKLSIYVL